VPNSIQRAAAVITVSETSKREIESAYPRAYGKTYAILNSASDAIQPVENAKDIVAREMGLDGPFILSVSTQWPRKNMQLAIDAVNLLPQKMPDKLVLTGKSGWGELTTDSRVVLPGYVSTELLCALYSAADLYLCPSFHEGFGIPLVEAFRCGCPVICSSGGALPEVAGDAAAVMPDFRPETWAHAIQEMLGDSSKLDGMKARGVARAKNFSWERSAQQHLEVYRQVLR
jgi:glycosyltransferase involved in cell wall biosynthesis